MKTYRCLAAVGLAAVLAPRLLAEGSMFGKFYVSAVAGKVECTSDGRIWDLAKGEAVLARGSSLRTEKGANITLVFSNQTSMYIDENTELVVRKFDQEPFSPNNNILLEPSNSQTVIALTAGQVIVNTPQLLSGTSMIFETPHAQMSVLNTQSGSEKFYIEVNAKQTHTAVITGKVAVKPRAKDGTFRALGVPLPANQQAFVKYSLNGSGDTDKDVVAAVSVGAGTSAGAGSVAASAAGANGEFTVTQADIPLDCKVPEGALQLKVGDHRLASGAILKTGASKATLLFANGCAYELAPNTELVVDKFTQEAFAPNNALAVEPSNSHTHVTLRSGSVDLTTPQLLGGTTLVVETVHSAISILNLPSGGEKASFAVDQKQTHFVLDAGSATVQPRDDQGNWSTPYPLKTGQQAFVKFTAGAGAKGAPASGAAIGIADIAASASAVTVLPAPVAPAGAPMVTAPAQATVLRVTGVARARLDEQGRSPAVEVAVGSQLPEGAVITTEAGAEVYLQPFVGAIAVLRENSEVHLEKLQTTVAGGVLMRQTALLDLRKGTIVSNIDPAKKNIDDYGVRTPKGIAQAHGTAFTATVDGDSSSVATTADVVTFSSPDGATYSVSAGNVTVTPAGGTPQPPVSLSQAVAANPQFGSVLQAAVTTIATVVQNNIGNLPASSATNLLTQIVSIASTALPAQAANFASQGVTAATASTASTSANPSGAAAAITAAAAAAAPAQAAAVASAATSAAPNLASTMAAAAASGAPAQAASVAAAVVQTLGQNAPAGTNTTQALTQVGASVAAAVTQAAPNQAAPVAAAVMQTIAQGSPQASVAALTQAASTLAGAITANAPSQASPVATALMQVVSQNNSQANNSDTSTAITNAANQGAASAGSGSAGGSSGTAGSGAGSTGGSSGSGGNSSGGSSSGAGSNGNSSGSNANGGGSQSTSIVITQVDNGSASTNNSSSNGGAANSGNGGTAQPTSIIVTQLNGGQLNQIAANLQLAQTAQSTVTFSTNTGGGGTTNTPTVTPTPIVPTITTITPESNSNTSSGQ